MSYRIAGIDVHKKMIVVVIADVMSEGAEYDFEQRKFGATPTELQILAEWMTQQEVQEAVMESTAQYWKPVWGALERYWTPECKKYQLTRQVVQVKNQLEAFLEETHIKLSSLISDLLGVSGRRILKALAEGETDPARLANLADQRLRATTAQLRDALGACTDLNAVYRRLLKMTLEQLRFLEEQIEQLEKECAGLLRAQRDAVERLAEVPGLGVDSAQQIIAEVGADAANFESAKDFSSWVGVCPGEEETAGESRSSRSHKGNRNLRRLLNQGAQCAVRVKGSIFELTFRRQLPRLGWKAAIWAIAHRLGRVGWKLLHDGVRYIGKGPAVSERSKKARTARMIKELRAIGYHVQPLNPEMGAAR